jgi:hypothetical protein
MNETTAAALDYRERGFSVFPLPFRKKSGRIKWKQFQSEHATEQQIRNWFKTNRNIAIVAGNISQLVVRDFDDVEKYRQWENNHPELATKAPTVATASGFHVYVTMDPIPRLRVSGVGSGELRGTGAYVVAPPSIHPSGKQYSWTIPLVTPLPIVTFADLDLEHLSPNFTEEDRRGTEADRLQKPWEGKKERKKGDFSCEIQRAIIASIPVKTGQRERKLFDLARRLKAIGELPDDIQIKVFDEWWCHSRDIVGTKHYELSMNAFLRCVSNATTPLDDIIGDCIERAKSTPVPDWSKKLCAECQLLAAICRELQTVNGTKPFFLSCRVAGAAIGVSHTIASQYLQLFVRLKQLTIVVRGSVSGHQATRYRMVQTQSFR